MIAVRVRRGLAPGREDGSVAVVLALAMVLFLSVLAAVVDSGQIFSARVVLAAATDSGAIEATQILSTGGCSSYAGAKAAARARVVEHSSTAVVESFKVTYGVIEVDDPLDCLLVLTDEKVGRVDLVTSDTRPYAFAGFFTDNSGSTSAAAAAQWGYVEGGDGRVSPLTLCDQNQGYLNYQQFRTDRAAHELNPLLPAPDPALLDPFDVEIDGYAGSPCEFDPSAEFGEFVLVDYFGDSGEATRAELQAWVEDGADDEVLLDDPNTLFVNEAYCPGEDSDKLGSCEGVTQGRSLDQVAHFEDMLGKTLLIMIHGDPQCDNNDVPPDYGHCNGGSRGHRVYDVSAFARVRILCLRNTALLAAGSPVSQAPGLPAGYCDTLGFTAADGNPGDDVMVRLEFLLDTTIQAGKLSSDPAYDHGFLGFNLCNVDGSDTCGF